jgi:hypothetical protein
MIVRFITPCDGKVRVGYVVRPSGDGWRVCTAPGIYFSVPKEDAEIIS